MHEAELSNRLDSPVRYNTLLYTVCLCRRNLHWFRRARAMDERVVHWRLVQTVVVMLSYLFFAYASGVILSDMRATWRMPAASLNSLTV